MEREKKERFTVFLPQKLSIEIFERRLDHHFSYLVALLVEGFIRATDVRISWMEMPNKAEQRAYLERKVRELFSRAGLSTEPPKPPVQESTEPSHVQGSSKLTEIPTESPKPPVQERTESIHAQEKPKDDYSATESKPTKEEQTAPPGKDAWWESFW
jgi:hypothetical protein